MPPIGNDIVDLDAPGNGGKSRDGRFLARVFTERERRLIVGAVRADLRLWALWAAKEAAYKAVSRDDPALCSIPHRYPVCLDWNQNTREAERLTGFVLTPQGEMALEVIWTAKWVHALAAPPDQLKRLRYRVDSIDGNEDPSAFVREKLLQEIACRNSCGKEEFSIVKDPGGPGVPRLLFRGCPLAAEVSLSHDGRFTAFAFDPVTLLSAVDAARAKS